MFVQFLFHEMAIIALAGGGARNSGELDLAHHFRTGGVMKPRAGAVQHRPIAFFEIGNAPCERSQRQRVRSHKHLPLTKADSERRALAGADQQIRMARENHRQRKGAMHPLQRCRCGSFGRMTALQEIIHQKREGFSIGFGLKGVAARFQFGAQLRVVFDDTVMDNNHARRTMWMRIARGWRAMRGPARMTNAGGAGQRACFQGRGQIPELALSTPAINLAVNKGGDAGTVIAAIFQTPQRFQKPRCRRLLPNHADNAAHQRYPFPLKPRPGLTAWRPRAIASASSGTSSVITLPAATSARAPTRTGATKAVSLPMKAPSPISVRCFATPS